MSTWWDRLAPEWRERLAINAATTDLEARIREGDASPWRLRREGVDADSITAQDVLALEALTLDREDIGSLRALKPLDRLRVVDLQHNRRLKSLKPLEGKPLEYLVTSGTALTKLDSLATLPTLRELWSYGTRVRDLTPLSHCLELRRLAVSFGTAIEDLAPLSALVKLEQLVLDRGKFTDLSPLATLHALRELDIGYNDIHDLTPLGNLSLHTLDIAQTEVATVKGLAPLKSLRVLKCYWTPVTSLDPIAGRLTELDCALGPDVVKLFPNLERVRFRQKSLGDASALATALELRSLVIDGRLNSLEPLATLKELEHLELGDPKIGDLSPLAGLHRLRSLELAHTKVSDLAPLAGLIELEELDLGNTCVEDLGALKKLDELRFLSIRGTPVKSLAPLFELPNLEHLIVDAHHRDLKALAEKRPKIRIEE